ncbi:MAG: NAD(+)/NADH kinase [Oscillospiraceae bacterium]|nr:NAD(+)/NADH kinase [Oscillospiraceae bacterium]
MQKICLFINEEKPGAEVLAARVRSALAACGIEALSFDEAARCEALVAIGGDGTILRGARLALPYSLPVLGVNAGRLGFLAGLEQDELELLQALAKPLTPEMLDTRILLEVRLYAGDVLQRTCVCINDATVARHSSSRIADLRVRCGDSQFAYMGDGVIFSTPTGSTAYSLSAGGPVLDPQLDSILLTPICNHLLFSRSILFAPGAAFRLPVPMEGLALTCDAEPPIPLHTGQHLEIHRAAEQMQFIRLKPIHFMDLLSKKLLASGGGAA